MLNFRYHVISIVAIFLGIALGIAIGADLSPSLDSSLANQAAVDREQVSQLRSQLDQQSRVNVYSEAWSKRVDSDSTKDVLAGRRLAVVSLSGAPTGVIDNLQAAIVQAGGSITTSLRVNGDALSDSAPPAVQLLQSADAAALGLDASASRATQLGELLGGLLGDLQTPPLDKARALKAVEQAGLLKVSTHDSEFTADLVLVVSSAKTTTDSPGAVTELHTRLTYGIAESTEVVVAGPNSTARGGSDLVSIRADGSSNRRVSTVDTADLASGQRVIVLTCKERLQGRIGNYGASPGVDGPFPN